MPCNATLVPYKQDPEGKHYVVSEEGEIIRCSLQFDGFPTGMARISHFVTCPFASQHRRRMRR